MLFYIVCTVFNGYGGTFENSVKAKTGRAQTFPTRAKAEDKARQLRADAAARINGPALYGYRVEQVAE